MKKLLIADDEPLVLIGVQSMLRWEEYGVEVCATARNGEQALALIEEHHPDIVISDIKMPLKTGLEVAAECREKNGALPVFIMLTSYEEFGFVKDAMHLGAVEYLIKLELTPQSLAASITRAMARLTQIEGAPAPVSGDGHSDLQAFREKFFVRLYSNLFESREPFEQQKNDLCIDFSTPAYAVAACEIGGIDTSALSIEKLLTLYTSTIQMVQDTAKKFLPCYVTSLDMRRFNILFCLPDSWSDAGTRIADILVKTGTLVHNYFNVDLRCAIGNPVDDAFLAHESYQSARAVSSLALPGHPAMADAVPLAENAVFSLAAYRTNLTHAFEELDTEALYDTITQIAACFECSSRTYVQAADAAGSLLYMAISLLPEGEATVRQIFAHEVDGHRGLYKLVTTEQCRLWMLRLRDGLCETLQSRRQSYKERVVASVKEYIRANLDKRLTLNDVAASFSFSPNYLSQLFARYSESGFVDYITEAKIGVAKVMLNEGQKKVYEIAESLGYDNAFYFSKVFKKVTSQSPREYLQNGQATPQ